MRIILHHSALDGEGTVLDQIDHLVDRASDEVHRLEVPDADRLLETAWYNSARPTRRQLLTAAIAGPPVVRTKLSGLHTKEIAVHDAVEGRRACELADTPLKIIMENRESDGTFLEVVIAELGSDALKALWSQGKKVSPVAVEMETGGGIGEMPVRIRRLATEAKDAGRPVRAFVMSDSDTRWPGDQRSAENVEKVRKTCADHGIPCHVLKKRCAECYIPDAVFEARRDDQQLAADRVRHEALLRRGAQQRDHFPIKAGLSTVERAEAMAAGLYRPEEEADLMLLEKPLFPKRPRPFLLLIPAFRVAFSAAGLRARDGQGELDALLAAIAEEL
jgi:hypothetical protein